MSMMSECDLIACAGLRGIQQVRRSRSTSRTNANRARNNVRQAKELMRKPGFEAELLAAKLLGRHGAIGYGKPKPEVVLRKEVTPSPFRQYYQQHFQGNAICNRGMEALYKSIVGKVSASCKAPEIDIKVKLPQHNEYSNFRFRPSVGTWNLTRHFEAEHIASKVQSNNALQVVATSPAVLPPGHQRQFQQYYQQNFLGNSLSSGILEGLYSQMRSDENANSNSKPAPAPAGHMFAHMPSVGTWHVPFKPIRTAPLVSAPYTECFHVPAPAPAGRMFSHMPSVGTWHVPFEPITTAPLVSSTIEKVAQKAYAPRLQARSHEYRENLENALSGTTSTIEPVPNKAYAPRFQARSHQYLTNLESALTRTTSTEEQPAPKAYVPRIQARSSQYLQTLENTLGGAKIGYAPRQQARSCQHLESLENALGGVDSNKAETAQQVYTPSLQSRSHKYLENLEHALSGTIEPLPAPYAPRLQQQSHLYLNFLEEALSPAESLEEGSTQTPLPADEVQEDRNVPGMVCIQSPILMGPSFWSMGLRPMPFLR